MRIEKKMVRKWFLPTVMLFYAAAVTVTVLLTGNNRLVALHNTFTLLLSLVSAGILMRSAMKNHNLGRGFYTSLGMCCLAMGNLYFLLLTVVSYQPDVISVGDFAKTCCYLFFIAELAGLLQTDSKKRGFSALMVALLSVTATVAIAFAVIVNEPISYNLSAILLNIVCLVLAIRLLAKKRFRFFAFTIALMAAKSTLSVFAVLSFATDSLSPLVYILMIQSVASFPVL